MKGLFKVIGVLLGVALLVVAGVGIYLYTQADSLIERAIESEGSAATGTAVAVDSVSLDFGEARGRISGLSVANPTGYASETALRMGDMALQIEPSSISKDVIVIKNMTITGTRLSLEQTTSGNNLKAVLDHVQQYASSSGDTTGSEPRVIIDRLSIDDTIVSVTVPQAGEAREVTIPKVVVEDIGRASNGATGAQVAKQVLDPLIQRALQSAAAAEIRGRVDDKLEEAKEKLKGSLLDKLGG